MGQDTMLMAHSVMRLICQRFLFRKQTNRPLADGIPEPRRRYSKVPSSFSTTTRRKWHISASQRRWQFATFYLPPSDPIRRGTERVASLMRSNAANALLFVPCVRARIFLLFFYVFHWCLRRYTNVWRSCSWYVQCIAGSPRDGDIYEHGRRPLRCVTGVHKNTYWIRDRLLYGWITWARGTRVQ